MTRPPSLSVVCFTNDPPHRVAAALGVLRELAAEIVVAVDASVDPDTLAPLDAVADRVVRAEFVAPLEANLAWLHDQARGDWVLRVDGDDVASQALVDRLAEPGWDRGVTHAYVSYRWLWDGPDRMLAQPPWWPDPALRLIRNVDGIVRFPTGAHRPAEVGGDRRFLDEAIYHLDLLLADEASREAKADRYELDATGLRTDPGWSVNSTYYLPERLDPPPRTDPLPSADADAVRRVLDAVAPAPMAGSGDERPLVRAADRLTHRVHDDPVALRVVAHPPLAAVTDRTYTVTVGVRNGGSETWSAHAVDAPRLAGWFLAADGAPRPDLAPAVAVLDGAVAPGTEALLRLALPQFPSPGPATLRLGLVQDGHAHPTTLDVAVLVQRGRRVLVMAAATDDPSLGARVEVTVAMAALTRHLPDVVPVLLTADPLGETVTRLAEDLGVEVAASPAALEPTRSSQDPNRTWEHELVTDAERLAAGDPVPEVIGRLFAPYLAADALVILPGAALGRRHRDASVGTVLLAARVAAALGLPVIVEGATLGRVDRRRDRLDLVRLARVAARLTTRDQASLDHLQALGAGDVAAAVVAPISTGATHPTVRGAAAEARRVLAEAGITGPYALASLRAGVDDHRHLEVLRMVGEALPPGTTLALLPHDARPGADDRSVLGSDQWSADHLAVLAPVEPATAAALAEGAVLTVGSRFTLSALARVAGVPAIHLLGDEADAVDAEWLADDPGVALVAAADAAAAARAVRTLPSSGDPRARWDGAAFTQALAPLLSPAPRLAGP